MKVLLTNDDGIQSPLLEPLLDALSSSEDIASASFVVPSQERSWVAQAVTKFQDITVRPRQLEKHFGYSIDGTPADCANLGIYTLQDPKPDLVLSGINIGTNAGLPFFLSSGTVGGASAAFLCGIRSLALSVHLPSEVFALWRAYDFESLKAYRNDWQRISEAGVSILKKLLRCNSWEQADIFSVNMPWGVEPTTPLRVTQLKRLGFASLYQPGKEPNVFCQKFSGFKEAPCAAIPELYPSDQSVLSAKQVSITPIRFAVPLNTADDWRQRLEATSTKE